MIIKCHVSMLEHRLRTIGYSLEEAVGAIIQVDGDHVIYDTESPAFPRKPKPGFVFGGGTQGPAQPSP